MCVVSFRILGHWRLDYHEHGFTNYKKRTWYDYRIGGGEKNKMWKTVWEMVDISLAVLPPILLNFTYNWYLLVEKRKALI